MKKAPLADLKQFLGTVFHPDWTIQHESFEHAVKKWMRKADDKAKKAVIHDINALLGQENDERLENWVCEEAKGDIFPPAIGFTYAAWLRYVGDTLAGVKRKPLPVQDKPFSTMPAPSSYAMRPPATNPQRPMSFPPIPQIPVMPQIPAMPPKPAPAPDAAPEEKAEAKPAAPAKKPAAKPAAKAPAKTAAKAPAKKKK